MKNELLALLQPHGQEHLLDFWDELSDGQRNRLATQIHEVNFSQVAQLFRGGADEEDGGASLADRAEPPPAFRLDGKSSRFSDQQARERGEQALREGKLGVILVAGGQGTRLGFHHPKGMFPLGPVSDRSLFQILVDHLQAVARRYGVRIPLFLMTSPVTHDETLRFLDEHDRFGLEEDELRIFCQGVMPAVDASTGKLLLADKGSLSLSPDGHGGMLAALHRNGCLAEAQRRGVEQLYYCQVDNPLAQICDPALLGYHLLSESEMTTQVVAKNDPLERVGNVVSVEERVRIIEYIDLSQKSAQRRNDDGSLRYWAGSIAVHVFDVSFLSSLADRADALLFHQALKKTSTIDASGQEVEPEENNSIKFERFIFDLLPHARNAVVVEADRAEAFAPVKNSSDAQTDTPETARALMINQHRRWLEAAGAAVATDIAVEINPKFALDSEELSKKIAKGLQVREPMYFQAAD